MAFISTGFLWCQEKGGETPERNRGRGWATGRAEAVWMNLRSHTFSHSLTHHGCLNPHSPPANHTIVSSGWQSQGFSTYKHSETICQTLPLRMSMCFTTYLVTSWRQRPRHRQHFEMKSSVREQIFKWYFPAQFQMLLLASHTSVLFQSGIRESRGAPLEITLNE